MRGELVLGALILAALLVLKPEAGLAAKPRASSFPVAEPARPLRLKLDSPPLPTWGHVGPLRLVYYTTDRQPFRDEDRLTILRELRVIKDFYAHFGLVITNEDRVYEVRGKIPSDLPAEQHDYYFILKRLRKEGLLVARRTIVFTTFDVGLGADMALTGLNDSTTRKLECPRPEKGYAWWCGYPKSAHWGGSVHEVGHMLGLSHPDDFTSEHPYLFDDGRKPYVFDEADLVKTVMGRHDRFYRHGDNGLLPHELDSLYRAYHDPGAPRLPAVARSAN